MTHGSESTTDQCHPAKPEAQAAETDETTVEFGEGMHHHTGIGG